ncbi:MAG: hypothetical protein L3J24_13205 [Xanthomonadales bacterium]|nr:hypothetical protein [Xanthomonadales bacterium]
MLDLKKQIDVIEKLIAENTIQSLTYAALECRLAIESICYERLKISFDYLAYKDLRGWQPKYVVEQVVAEANEMADQEFSLAIAAYKPGKKSPETVEDFEDLKFHNLGKQSKLDLNKLGKLWNAISNVALHVSLPKSKEDEVSNYGNKDKILKKVNDVLIELKGISKGNLIMGQAGKTGLCYTFDCGACGSTIRKSVGLLEDNQAVNCISPSCMESYIIKKDGDTFTHTRYKQDLACKKCQTINHIPHNYLTKFRYGQSLTMVCKECEYKTEMFLQVLVKNYIEE